MKRFFFSRLIAACLLILSALSVGGCGSSNAFTCGDVVLPGIVVTVVDAQTHASIADGAVATAQSGTVVETLRPHATDAQGKVLSFQGAFDGGVFTVRVTKTGYQPYEMKNVRVVREVCGVRTVSLEADLQPAK